MRRDDRQSRGFALAFWLLVSFVTLTVLVVADLTRTLEESWSAATVDAEVLWLVGVAEVFRRIGEVPIALSTAVGVGGLLFGTAFLLFVSVVLAMRHGETIDP